MSLRTPPTKVQVDSQGEVTRRGLNRVVRRRESSLFAVGRSVTGRSILVAVGLFLIVSASPLQLTAQDKNNTPAKPAEAPPLTTDQEAILLKYKRFAQVLQEMTEYLRTSEPDRAALLSQVSRKSNESQIVERMDRLIELIEKGKLGEAIEEEEDLVASLQMILDMMNSEDRAKELAEEKARIEAYLKDLNRLIGGQRDVRAATERGGKGEELAPRQESLEQQADRLRQQIQQEQKKGKPGDPSSKQNSETEPQDSQPGDQDPESKSESEDAQNQKGASELQKAQQAMRDALEKLQKDQGREASEQQDQALLELEKAKEKLEEILRQLREEERDRRLVGLEERLQRLLAGELLIYTETAQVAEVPAAERTSRHRNKGIQLSRQQTELSLEAEGLLRLLREEGTAVAFPEVVLQVRDDMQGIAARLGRGDFGDLTLTMETDVIDSLKEMILTLQKQMEENRQKKMQSGQPQQGSQDEEELVQTIAELKMLRSLQVRINSRTKQIGKLVTSDQAEEAELVQQMKKLAEAQTRIQRATYDLATRKNE